MPHIDKISKPSWIDQKEIDNKSFESRKKNDLYYTDQWRKIRLIKLNLNPICEHCEKRGIVTAAKVIDHIIPIEQGGDKLSLDNLQSLCRRCDNIKSGKDAHKYK